MWLGLIEEDFGYVVYQRWGTATVLRHIIATEFERSLDCSPVRINLLGIK